MDDKSGEKFYVFSKIRNGLNAHLGYATGTPMVFMDTYEEAVEQAKQLSKNDYMKDFYVVRVLLQVSSAMKLETTLIPVL